MSFLLQLITGFNSLVLWMCLCTACYLGNSWLVLLHQLIHVFLVLLHTRLQVVLLPLQPAQLFLQLGERRGGGGAFLAQWQENISPHLPQDCAPYKVCVHCDGRKTSLHWSLTHCPSHTRYLLILRAQQGQSHYHPLQLGAKASRRLHMRSRLLWEATQA